MQYRIQLLMALTFLAPQCIRASCSVSTFQHNYGSHPIHSAMAITDPLGEQTAKFDLAFGGALVSLKFNNTELVDGDVPGAMYQTNWFAGFSDESTRMTFFYNPQTGGDNALSPPTDIRGNPVHGSYCSEGSAGNTVTIVAASTDYNLGRGGIQPMFAVYSGGPQRGFADPNPFPLGCPDLRVNCAQIVAPYTITTVGTFVPSGTGHAPHYYLKLTQITTNVSFHESFLSTLEIAGYGNRSFTTGQGWAMDNTGSVIPGACTTSPGCITSSASPTGVKRLLGGAYPSSALTGGIAMFAQPGVNWSIYTAAETVWMTLIPEAGKVNILVPGGPQRGWPIFKDTSLRWTWYVLAGDWQDAVTFAGAPVVP